MTNPVLKAICCDTCPYTPTCEEENQFLADIGLGGQWGDEYGDEPYPDDYEPEPYCVTPGCDCCDYD